MSIKEKYNTKCAALYRAKLICDVEGRPFDATQVAWSPQQVNPSFKSSSPDLSRKPDTNMFPSAAPLIPSKEQNENYFGRMGEMNSSRPEYVYSGVCTIKIGINISIA
jgi:ADP-ribosylation factor GTPase-activating protein 1